MCFAETGADMSVFPTAEHLASWVGVSPGSNESAGRIKSAKTLPGNRHLKAALGVAALSASRSTNTTSAPASDASPAAGQPDPEPRNRAASPPPGRLPSLRSNTRCGSPEIVEGFLCRFRLGLGFPDLVVDGR